MKEKRKISVVEMLAGESEKTQAVWLKLQNEIEKAKSKGTCYAIDDNGALIPIQQTQEFQDEMKKQFSVTPTIIPPTK